MCTYLKRERGGGRERERERGGGGREREREGEREGGREKEWEVAREGKRERYFVPGLVYTSKKSPAAMEKSPKVGRSHGFTSGMLIFVSWSS